MRARCSSSGCNSEAINFATFMSPEAQPVELAFCKEHRNNVPMDYLIPDPRNLYAEALCSSTEECYLHAVVWLYEPEQFVVVLKSQTSGSIFVVQTGYIEAALIQAYAKKLACSHRTTFELILDIIQELDASVIGVVVQGYDKRGDTYQCYIGIESGGRVLRFSCRISDAVALSLVANVPVQVNTAFLGKDLTSQNKKQDRAS
jgi:bifunctional DNase/RNase